MRHGTQKSHWTGIVKYNRPTPCQENSKQVQITFIHTLTYTHTVCMKHYSSVEHYYGTRQSEFADPYPPRSYPLCRIYPPGCWLFIYMQVFTKRSSKLSAVIGQNIKKCPLSHWWRTLWEILDHLWGGPRYSGDLPCINKIWSWNMLYFLKSGPDGHSCIQTHTDERLQYNKTSLLKELINDWCNSSPMKHCFCVRPQGIVRNSRTLPRPVSSQTALASSRGWGWGWPFPLKAPGPLSTQWPTPTTRRARRR